MDPTKLRALLERVRAGEASIDTALTELKDLPFVDLGYAVVDHHRGLRQGVPEVILAQSKTAEQVAGIAKELARTGQNVLITRLSPEQATRRRARAPGARVHAARPHRDARADADRGARRRAASRS